MIVGNSLLGIGGPHWALIHGHTKEKGTDRP